MLPDFIDKELWEDFMAVRKKKKAVNSDRAVKLLINELIRIHTLGGDANAEIERSIINSWKSIYWKPAGRAGHSITAAARAYEDSLL